MNNDLMMMAMMMAMPRHNTPGLTSSLSTNPVETYLASSDRIPAAGRFIFNWQREEDTVKRFDLERARIGDQLGKLMKACQLTIEDLRLFPDLLSAYQRVNPTAVLGPPTGGGPGPSHGHDETNGHSHTNGGTAKKVESLSGAEATVHQAQHAFSHAKARVDELARELEQARAEAQIAEAQATAAQTYLENMKRIDQAPASTTPTQNAKGTSPKP